MTPFRDPAVAAKFESYPPIVRRRLLALRELVFRTAAATPGVGEIEETLKWSEPAYITRNGAGSTVRIDWKSKAPGHYAVYFNCRTNLIETFRSLFPRDFKFEGNRAVLFAVGDHVPNEALSWCVAASLTYHLRRVAKAK
jgi:hypothetical protein